MQDILDLRMAANQCVEENDFVAAIVLDELALELERGATWSDLLDDIEVTP